MNRRRHSRPHEHVSHERWLVSYADFVTLLFAFFVVMFASSYHDRQSVKKVSQAIEGGFQQMGASSSSQILPAWRSLRRGLTPASRLTTGVPAKAAQSSTSPQPAVSAVDLAELQRQLKDTLGKEISRNEIVMRMTPEGFVISLREMGFFNSGEAKLLPGAGEKIGRIGTLLMQHGFDVRVEGHSDDVPIHTAQFRSNWELSTARAMAVLLLLVDKTGFDPEKISVAGYGQYRPVSENDTPEGRRMNRRVDLVVVGVPR